MQHQQTSASRTISSHTPRDAPLEYAPHPPQCEGDSTTSRTDGNGNPAVDRVLIPADINRAFHTSYGDGSETNGSTLETPPTVRANGTAHETASHYTSEDIPVITLAAPNTATGESSSPFYVQTHLPPLTATAPPAAHTEQHQNGVREEVNGNRNDAAPRARSAPSRVPPPRRASDASPSAASVFNQDRAALRLPEVSGGLQAAYGVFQAPAPPNGSTAAAAPERNGPQSPPLQPPPPVTPFIPVLLPPVLQTIPVLSLVQASVITSSTITSSQITSCSITASTVFASKVSFAVISQSTISQCTIGGHQAQAATGSVSCSIPSSRLSGTVTTSSSSTGSAPSVASTCVRVSTPPLQQHV